ncbi:hypothetical protein FRC12_014657 [Ceratobasidium sp. 428]|nr:hypothetical protein FRC12_014657 [Ceratobasidium sp. 428]
MSSGDFSCDLSATTPLPTLLSFLISPMTIGPTIYTAVIGCGIATQIFHVPLLLAQRQLFTLKTIVEKAGPKPVEAINKLNRTNIKWTSDFEEVLRDEDIELVVIATPNHLHFNMAKASLEAGKHGTQPSHGSSRSIS